MRKTVLQTAVMCDGQVFPEGTDIEDIPSANRESVRLRFCHDVEVKSKEESKSEPSGGNSNRAPSNRSTNRSSKPSDADKAQAPAPAAPTGEALQPPADTPAANDAPQTTTPLPAMAEELLALLKAGGIETVEQAKAYFDANKSFRPLKGVSEPKDADIRKALGL